MFAPDAFPAGRRGYLDTPSMGLPCRGTVDAVRQALDGWYAGTAAYPDWEATMERCRVAFAVARGLEPDTVGLVPSVTTPLASIGAVLAQRPGVVVAHRDEFRSLLLPVLAAVGADRFRWVEGSYRWRTFAAAMDGPVAAVLVSAVSSADGARPDLERLVAAAGDAPLIVDSTQAEGIVGLGVDYHRLGAVVAAGYKGLLAPRGTGYVVARPDLLAAAPLAASPYGMADGAERGPYGPPLRPRTGASRLDQSPAWLSWVGAEPALDLLATCGPDRIEAHVLTLAGRLRAALGAAGIATTEGDLPSPVVSVGLRDVAAGTAVVQALAAAGVRAAVRLGRLRMGFHLYNVAADVDAAAAVLLGLDRRFFERTRT